MTSKEFNYQAFWKEQDAKIADLENFDDSYIPMSNKRNVDLDLEQQQMLGWKQLIESEKKKIDQPNIDQIDVDNQSYFEIPIEQQGELPEIAEQEMDDGCFNYEDD